MYRLTEKEKNRAMTLLEDVLSTVSMSSISWILRMRRGYRR